MGVQNFSAAIFSASVLNIALASNLFRYRLTDEHPLAAMLSRLDPVVQRKLTEAWGGLRRGQEGFAWVKLAFWFWTGKRYREPLIDFRATSDKFPLSWERKATMVHAALHAPEKRFAY